MLSRLLFFHLSSFDRKQDYNSRRHDQQRNIQADHRIVSRPAGSRREHCVHRMVLAYLLKSVRIAMHFGL